MHLRNGDWSFKKIDESDYNKLSKGLSPEKHDGIYTFAEGEATGHLHQTKVKNKENMTFIKMPDGSYLVKLEEEGLVTHPEHSLKVDIKVPPATYRLYKRREKDWFSLATRKVVD